MVDFNVLFNVGVSKFQLHNKLFVLMNILLDFRKGTNYNDYLMQYIFFLFCIQSVGKRNTYTLRSLNDI